MESKISKVGLTKNQVVIIHVIFWCLVASLLTNVSQLTGVQNNLKNHEALYYLVKQALTTNLDRTNHKQRRVMYTSWAKKTRSRLLRESCKHRGLLAILCLIFDVETNPGPNQNRLLTPEQEVAAYRAAVGIRNTTNREHRVPHQNRPNVNWPQDDLMDTWLDGLTIPQRFCPTPPDNVPIYHIPDSEDVKVDRDWSSVNLPRLQLFPARPDRVNVDRWVAAVRLRARVYSWSALQVEAQLVSLLSGAAADLFHSLSDGDRGDLEKVLELLLSEFGGGGSTGRAQHDFLRASLNSSETVVEFYWRLSDLLRSAFPTLVNEEKDQTLKDAFVRGLPFPYRDRLAPLEHGSARDALQAAKNLEEFRREAVERVSVVDPMMVVGARSRPPAPMEEPMGKEALEGFITREVAKKVDELGVNLSAQLDNSLKGFRADLQAATMAMTRMGEGQAGQNRAPGMFRRPYMGNCFNCGKAGHPVAACRYPRDEALIGQRRTEFTQNRGQARPVPPASYYQSLATPQSTAMAADGSYWQQPSSPMPLHTAQVFSAAAPVVGGSAPPTTAPVFTDRESEVTLNR